MFAADWHPAISANPYQSFFFKATESGEFTFTWKDDDGSEYTAKNKLDRRLNRAGRSAGRPLHACQRSRCPITGSRMGGALRPSRG